MRSFNLIPIIAILQSISRNSTKTICSYLLILLTSSKTVIIEKQKHCSSYFSSRSKLLCLRPIKSFMALSLVNLPFILFFSKIVYKPLRLSKSNLFKCSDYRISNLWDNMIELSYTGFKYSSVTSGKTSAYKQGGLYLFFI